MGGQLEGEPLKLIAIAHYGVIGGETWWEWEGERYASYELALSAAQAGGITEEEDLQEARSVRYVDFARVVVLSSGRWAVFVGTGEGEDLEICRTPEQLVDAIRRAQEQEGSSWLKRLEVERAERERSRTAPPVQVASKNAGDLGL